MFRSSIGLSLALSLGLVVLADAPHYRVEPLGAGWTGTGMNNHGDVCGHISPDGTALLAGVARAGRAFEYLPLPAGMQSSRAHGINDAGVIVGAVAPNQYVITQPRAAAWRPAGLGYAVELLPAPPGLPFSSAYAINNLSDIVGAAGSVGYQLTTGVLYTPTEPVLLPNGMLGSDVNDLRLVLSGPRLLSLDTWEVIQIPLPPGSWNGFASAALNNRNDFCGSIRGYSSCSLFPVRYRQGVGWEFLGSCASTAASATAINDAGDTLSYYYPTTAGVTFVDGGYYMLGSLLAPGQGAWYIQYGGANAINNAGQILASARAGLTGPIGAVRLSPIHPFAIGDLNCDGVVNFNDIDGFVLALVGAEAFAAAYPACDLLAADANGDSRVDFGDIEAFAMLLAAR